MSDQPAKKPNFLIICTDQMRADHLGVDGNPKIRTPNLDRLAEQGSHLPRAYVNCPLCMPCRATLTTGLTPRGHGVRTNGIPLRRDLPTVAGTLAQAGYRTASIGKIHVTNYGLHEDAAAAPAPEDFPEIRRFWDDGTLKRMPTPYYGFEHVEITLGHGSGVRGDYANWLGEHHPDADAKRTDASQHIPADPPAEGCATIPIDEDLHHTAWVADRTMDYLDKSQGDDQPFYLWCSFPDPHHPYQVPAPWSTMYGPDDVEPPVRREGELNDLPPFFRKAVEGPIRVSGRQAPTQMTDEQRRQILAYTYGMVSMIDHHVGRVLDKLEAIGEADNTVVLFISDHGDMMGDHGLLNKGPFHFEGLLRVPMIWRMPGCFPARGSVPAMASLLDVPPTVMELAGVEIPQGPASNEAPLQPPAWPGRSLVPILTGEIDDVQDSVVVENDEDYLGLRVRTLITHGAKVTTYTGHRGPERYGELFDLVSDPDELHNLWDDPAFADLKKDMIVRLHYRLAETDIAVPRRLGHA